MRTENTAVSCNHSTKNWYIPYRLWQNTFQRHCILKRKTAKPRWWILIGWWQLASQRIQRLLSKSNIRNVETLNLRLEIFLILKEETLARVCVALNRKFDNQPTHCISVCLQGACCIIARKLQYIVHMGCAAEVQAPEVAWWKLHAARREGAAALQLLDPSAVYTDSCLVAVLHCCRGACDSYRREEWVCPLVKCVPS